MLTNIRTILIEWGDCDPAGIVFYPRYFAWFDAATAALFAAAGLPIHKLFPDYGIAGMPMVDTRARFFEPARFGDEVRIESVIAEFRRSSFDVRHRLFRGDTLTVEGFETRVWTVWDPEDPERLKAASIPAEVIARFTKT
ncbi:MAG: acyl-CoA thioesterase [Blastocatellia bacterium]